MKTKFLGIISVLCLCSFLFTACGSSATNSTAAYENTSGAVAAPMMDAAEVEEGKIADAGTSAPISAPQDARKIIYNADIEMEALNFDDTCAAVKQAVRDVGGYLSYSEAFGVAGESQRRARFTCRIPAEQYEAFMTSVNENGNVTGVSESTEDITMAYVDVEARLTSLRAQEERLLDMLAKSGDLDTLLAVQQQLTEVQYQMESYTAQQRTYDDLLAYCTVDISIDEVHIATPNANSFGNRVSTAFAQTGRNIVVGAQDFVILLIYALPLLVILAIVLFFILRSVKKQRVRKQSLYTANAETKSNKAETAKTPATYTAPTETEKEDK